MHVDRRDRAEGHALPRGPEDRISRIACRSDRARRQLHHQSERPLALQQLGRHGPAESRLDHRLHVGDAEAETRDGVAVDAVWMCGWPDRRSRPTSAAPETPWITLTMWSASLERGVLAEELDTELALDAGTASLTLSSITWLKRKPTPGRSLTLRCMASTNPSRSCAVTHSSRGSRDQHLGLIEAVHVRAVVRPAELRHHVPHLREGRDDLAHGA